jgi:uncharacterized protein YndB with AHSA1/START domain
MGHISRTIHVGATPEQVFDLLVNPERIPEWQVPDPPVVKDIRGTPGTVGFGFTLATTFAGRRMEQRATVTVFERPRLFELEYTGNAMAATARGRLEPAAGGTEVTIESAYEMPLGFIGGAADKLFFERSFADSWDKSLEKFKALVEAEVPVHA